MKVDTSVNKLNISRAEVAGRVEDMALIMRRDIVKMISLAGSGHPGGSLSATDIVAALYFGAMRHDPSRPDWPERDRFVLSKGHAAPVLYAALAESGYFDRSLLWTLRSLGSPLQGHPDMLKVAGVEISTGSLGQGLAVAVGMALAAKMDGSDHRVYCVIGDGESQEGEIWEAGMMASHYRLDNLICITDYNDLQIDGRLSEVKDVCPIDAKWQAFNWQVYCVDGHNVTDLLDVLELARESEGKPIMIEARTVKGKGVSFMEDQVDWHGKAPNADETARALKELGVDSWQ